MRGSRDEGCLSEGELEWQAADFFSREPSALDQTRHKSVEMLRVYCRDAKLFNGNAAAGLL
jgi:hypothetical protein